MACPCIMENLTYWCSHVRLESEIFFVAQELSITCISTPLLIFNIFCSANDANLVYKNVASKNHNICYEARLVSLNGDRLVKPRRVACYVSPKQITIKDYVLKFFPKRLYTFRLCPSTKVFNSF